MGMSASQARLLSLTTRLTNNELQSQLTTNAKLRLAEKTSLATQEYMDSLSSQKLVYGLYNDDGDYTDQNLTANVIYNYEPLKNQYAIINTAGKMLVSNKDATNFKNTKNLHEFLECYNLVEDVKLLDNYEIDWQNYQSQLAEYDDLMKIYLNDKKIWDEEYGEWVNAPGKKDLYALFSGAVGTSAIKDEPEVSHMYNSTGCYWHALNPITQDSASCYQHVLNHIIDFDGSRSGNNGKDGMYYTSCGDEIIISEPSGGYMENSCNDEMKEVSDGINEKDADGNYLRYCDGTDDLLGVSGITNRLEKANQDYAAGTINDTEYKLQKLLSDFVDNNDGTFSRKSLKQKAIDFMYISRNWGPAQSDDKATADLAEFPEAMLSRETMIDALINFTDGDLKNLTLDPPSDPPTPPTKPTEPVKPQFPIKLNDKDKGQWYVNLWHYMNGSDAANLVEQTNLEYNGSEELIFTVKNADTLEIAKNGGKFEVIDDNLASNSEWLQFALEHGVVTLAKAEFFNPSVDSQKVPEITSEGITWNSIIHTSATDIRTKDDEVAVTVAEVKYKKTIKEIQSEDKKYDQDLKQLDTEHSALLNEYESLKTVIGKNVERSFKIFS